MTKQCSVKPRCSEDNALDDVGDVLERSWHFQRSRKDLLPLDDGDPDPSFLEKPGQGAAQDLVATFSAG